MSDSTGAMDDYHYVIVEICRNLNPDHEGHVAKNENSMSDIKSINLQ